MLHPQERKLAAKARGWREYDLATESDAGVAAFWRWLSQHAGLFAFFFESGYFSLSAH